MVPSPHTTESILRALQETLPNVSKQDTSQVVHFLRVYLDMCKSSHGKEFITVLQDVDEALIEKLLEALILHGEPKEDPLTLWEHLEDS